MHLFGFALWIWRQFPAFSCGVRRKSWVSTVSNYRITRLTFAKKCHLKTCIETINWVALLQPFIVSVLFPGVPAGWALTENSGSSLVLTVAMPSSLAQSAFCGSSSVGYFALFWDLAWFSSSVTFWSLLCVLQSSSLYQTFGIFWFLLSITTAALTHA